MASYESLRNAKAAFDEGLIDEQDVQIIRTAFLRAQQIKAGLDAGFIQEDDFNSVKQAFMNSLNMSAEPSALLGGFHPPELPQKYIALRRFCAILCRLQLISEGRWAFDVSLCMHLMFPLYEMVAPDQGAVMIAMHSIAYPIVAWTLLRKI